MVIIFFLYLIAHEQKESSYERRAERLVSRYGDTEIITSSVIYPGELVVPLF
jgi:hypothetical protein